MEFFLDVGLAIVFAIPILVSNATPHIFGGGYPIDGYKNLKDGKRILGDHKTIQGFLVGVISGLFTSIFIWAIFNDLFIARYESIGFQYPAWIGLLMGFGCNFGDLLGSFIKRRINIQSGGRFPVFDQMGYILFGLLWSWPAFVWIPWTFWITLLILAPLIHILANVLGYYLGVKEVPW